MELIRKNALGLLAQGEFEGARGLFQRMLDQSDAGSPNSTQHRADEITETRIEALLGLGLCDRSENRLHSAVEYFERCLSLRPSLAVVENLLSLYRELGDEGKRQAAARRALEMSVLPSDQRARFVMIAGNV